VPVPAVFYLFCSRLPGLIGIARRETFHHPGLPPLMHVLLRGRSRVISGGALPVGSRPFDVTWASRREVGNFQRTQAEKDVTNQVGPGIVKADRKDKAFSVRALTAASTGMRFRPASPVCGDEVHQPVNPIRRTDSSLSGAMHHECFFKFHHENLLHALHDDCGKSCPAMNR
jgi:hypothetical protein